MRAAALSFPPVESLRAVSLSRLLPSGAALLTGFALLAGAALAYVGAKETSLFALRSIEISGAPPRVAGHVRAALRPLEGKSLVALGGASIERRLADLPDVAAVSFDRDFPHTLRVVVTPAHSVAVLRRGASAWIVSSDGRVIRPAGPFVAPRLPRVWIPRAASVDVGNRVGDVDAARAVRAIVVARAEGLAVRIRTVRASDRELTFVLPSTLEIRLGGDASLPLKVAVARRILPLLGGSSTYLDVSVPSRPFADGASQLSG
jgi:cell division protein FtsQ